jgi:hypothetical protein
MGVGEIALVALAVAVVAMIALVMVGYLAVNARPTLDNLRPDVEPRRVLTGLVLMLAAAVAWIVFLVAGVVWIVQAFTGGA